MLRLLQRLRPDSPMSGPARFNAFCAGAALALFRCAHAAAPDPQAWSAAEAAFAADVARSSTLSADAVLATLSQARYQQAIIDAMTRPAEAKPWKDYRPIFVTDRRIDDGVAFLEENSALLARIEAETGVPAALIVTILGIETNYGRATGRYRVLDALATLAFAYPPRQDFFRSELKQLFLLQGPAFPYPLEQLTGSYAGAMGWGQFMPSSITNFARDGDHDGRIDLWTSRADICASVANYFVAHGWQKGGAVAARATVAADAKPLAPASLEPAYSLQQLDAWGYRIEARSTGAGPDSSKAEPKPAAARLDPMTPASMIVLDGADGPETWITFENFYAITRYNRSPLYSLAVHQLSQAIAAGARGEAP